MSRTRFLIVLMFFFTLTAGILIGLVSAGGRLICPVRPHLSRELHLSSAQERKIQETWTRFMESRHRAGRRERFKDVDLSRLEELQSRLPDEQKPVVAEIIDEIKNLESNRMLRRKAMIDSVVEETKKILDENQRMQYEKLLEERGYPGPFPPHYPHPRGMGMRGRFHMGENCQKSPDDSTVTTKKGETR